VDGRGVDAHEHIAVSDARWLDLAEVEDLFRSVVILDDGLHGGLAVMSL
jgi:hypothetical protein